ncbi:FMRFamide-related peptides [Drosophila tropicalis]|uniref:FMRFamide-related peptides n=1 Tax=Drosophila tropicalis TaxID=46794 RepID=UPI0035AB83F3
MGIALMFLLALYQMQSAIHSEVIETPYNANALISEPEDDTDTSVPVLADNGLIDSLLDEKPEQTELEFRYPISAIGIDYGKNSVVLRFQKNARKQRYKFDPEMEAKRKSLQDNFMHFGKRQPEQLPLEPQGNAYYEPEVKRSPMDRYGRDPKQDFMRFGRDPKQDFMRFGRDPKQDFMRFGRDPKDFMRFGRTPSDFMRFGRTPSDFMRFGRADNFMRFGRSPHEELRSPKQDFMRFGRPDNFMRFGRSAPPDFEHYGKMDSNFIRFGKSVNAAAPPVTPEANQTKSQSQSKDKTGNPMNKAMSMLFTKEQPSKSSEQAAGSGDNSDDTSVEQFYGP